MHNPGTDAEFEPVGTEYNQNWTLLQAVDNCRSTHVDSRCNVSAIIAVALIRGLIRREVQTEKQIDPLIQRCKRHIDYWAQSQNAGDNSGAYFSVLNSSELSRLLTAQSLEELQLDNSEDRGDVWKCLASGMFCLRTAMVRLESLSGQQRQDRRKVLFAEIIDRLAKEGGAAQANAAFAGALLGAYLGFDAIPQEQIKGLSHKDFLMRKCRQLCRFVKVIPRGPNIRERDSKLFPGRNASERRAMQGTIQNQRRLRKQMLAKRWNDPDLRAERRRTVYGSLQFPLL